MMAEPTSNETGKKATYNDFISQAELVVDKKEGLQKKILNLDGYSEYSRQDIIDHVALMKADVDYMFSEDEKYSLEETIRQMQSHSDAISTLESFANKARIEGSGQMMSSEIRAFKAWSNKFVELWGKFLESKNLGLQTSESKGEIDGLYRAYNIKQWFSNSYGVLVSPQMEVFCRWLYCRAKANWDNVIIVEGIQGTGKSSFIYGAFTTLAEMLGQKLDLQSYDKLLFKEDREYCMKLIKKAPGTAQFWYDEAGNQFNKGAFYVKDQRDLVNDVNLNRDSRFTSWLAWGDAKLLDSDLRNFRALGVVSIKERGAAVFRQFNMNPSAAKGMTENPKIKSKVITSQAEAHQILEHDLLTRLVIPFYDPSVNKNDKNFKAYLERKAGAKRLEVSIFDSKSNKRADDFYRDFLVSLDPSFLAPGSIINNELLSRYAQSLGQYMSMSALATRLARATGTTTNKVLMRDNPADLSSGKITLDRILIGYIERLKAQSQGSKDASAEGINEVK
ncbi:MAG: hypothetical protein KGH64_00800 [Candidatus Micrarchaeota archaeon]|nr:hypothetical protein [Candidatus Micrarchaeota archaeon]